MTKHMRSSCQPKYVPRAGDGCVLWLPGQDDPQSNVYMDRSGWGNHGTIDGAIWKQTDKGLWVLSFDGNDDIVNLGTDSSKSATSNVTIEFWFNALTLRKQGIIRQGDSYVIYIDEYYKFLLQLSQSPYTTKSSDYSVSADTWYHGAVTIDADSLITFYVNGNPEGTPGTMVIPQDSSGTLYLSYTWGSKWHGYIAMARIHNSMITARELKAHYNQERHLFGV